MLHVANKPGFSILCHNIFMFIGAHFVAFGLVSSEPTQMISREERLQSDLLCVKWNTKLIKSINFSASVLPHLTWYGSVISDALKNVLQLLLPQQYHSTVPHYRPV